MVLREVLKHARKSHIEKLLGVYLPTARNGLVRDHYANLGFSKVREEESGLTLWEFQVSQPPPEGAPMLVVSE